MKYTQEQLEAMSDCKLNVALTGVVNNEDYSQWAITADDTQLYHCENDGSQHYAVDILDYCKSPDDIMPLAFECGLTVGTIDGDHFAFSDFDYGVDEQIWENMVYDDNPLRALVIVYILVKQEKTN